MVEVMAKPRGLYTPVYASLPRHEKVQRAATALHCDRHKLVGHLVSLWTWCLDGYTTGRSLAAESIALGAEWPARQAAKFSDALADAGLLERVGDGYRVHEWDEYGGKVARLQQADRERHSGGISEELPQSFHGNSSLDETRLEEIRDPIPTESVKAKRARAKPDLSDEDRLRLHGRYDQFWTAGEVDERIHEALTHKASQKWTDVYAGVNGWLRRDIPRTAGGGARAQGGGPGQGTAGARGVAAFGARSGPIVGAFPVAKQWPDAEIGRSDAG